MVILRNRVRARSVVWRTQYITWCIKLNIQSLFAGGGSGGGSPLPQGPSEARAQSKNIFFQLWVVWKLYLGLVKKVRAATSKFFKKFEVAILELEQQPRSFSKTSRLLFEVEGGLKKVRGCSSFEKSNLLWSILLRSSPLPSNKIFIFVGIILLIEYKWCCFYFLYKALL